MGPGRDSREGRNEGEGPKAGEEKRRLHGDGYKN